MQFFKFWKIVIMKHFVCERHCIYC